MPKREYDRQGRRIVRKSDDGIFKKAHVSGSDWIAEKLCERFKNCESRKKHHCDASCEYFGTKQIEDPNILINEAIETLSWVQGLISKADEWEEMGCIIHTMELAKSLGRKYKLDAKKMKAALSLKKWCEERHIKFEGVCNNALDMKNELEILRQTLENDRGKHSVYHAFQAGRYYERMGVQIDSLNLRRGRTVVAGGRKGKARSHETKIKNDKIRREDAFKFFDYLYSRHSFYLHVTPRGQIKIDCTDHASESISRREAADAGLTVLKRKRNLMALKTYVMTIQSAGEQYQKLLAQYEVKDKGERRMRELFKEWAKDRGYVD